MPNQSLVSTLKPKGLNTTIGGIESVFGAKNINNTPAVLPKPMTPNVKPQIKAATPAPTKTAMPVLPKELPKTGKSTDRDTVIGDFMTDVKNGADLTGIRNSYPEFSGLDDQGISDLITDAGKYDTTTILKNYPELNGESLPSVMQTAKNIVGAAGDSATGIAKLAGKGIAEGVGYIAKKVGANPQKTDYLVNDFKSYLDESQPGKNIGSDKNSLTYKGTKLGADVIQSVIPTAEAGAIEKGVSKLLPFGSNLLKKTIQYGAQGVADTAKYTAISESRLPTAGEMAAGGAIGAAIPALTPAVSKGFGKAKNFISSIMGKTEDLPAIAKKVVSKKPLLGAATTYEEPSQGFMSDLIDRGKKFLDNGVDDITQRAFKEGKITVGEFDRAKKIAQRAATDINAKNGFEVLADDIANATDQYVTQPRKLIGKQIGDIKQAMKDRGMELTVDSKKAIDALDDILKTDYKASIVGDEVVPVGGGVHSYQGDEKTILDKLRSDILNIKNADDITTTFENANKLYDDIESKMLKGKINPRLKRQMGKVREALEQQLDSIMGPDYRKLRLKYQELLGLEDKFRYLFSRSKPGMKEDYSSIARIKKLFSPDKGAVMDEFKLLKDVTGIDFASRAQMFKFLAEQFGDERSLSLLNLVKKAATGDRSIANIVKGVVSYADEKIRGNPLDIATRIVNKLQNIPERKKVMTVKSIKKVIEKINRSATQVSKKDALKMIEKGVKIIK